MKPSEKLQQAIIGCMLLFPEERQEVADRLTEADFLHPDCRKAYRYLVDNPESDALMAVSALGIEDMYRWIETEFSAAFLAGYCKDLREMSSKAQIWQALTDIRNQAADLTSSELYELAEKTLIGLKIGNSGEMKSIRELAGQAFKRLEDRYRNRGRIQGLSWGFEQLDSLTGGAQRGDMIVIAGRPSMGKSALAMNLVENMAARGSKAAAFSLEMADVQLMDRMIASHSKVSLGRIRNGDFHDGDWTRLTKGFERISGLPISIDDTPGIGLQEIKSKCRALKRREGLDVVMVDYLTLLKTSSTGNRTREVGELSRGLKQMARELEAAVLVLCQLNRAGAGRKPVMSDLRDSGEIEQDADVILFPYREAADCQKCRDKVEDAEHSQRAHERQAEIIIEKQRNGPRNVSIPFTWIGEHQRFEEVGG